LFRAWLVADRGLISSRRGWEPATVSAD